MRLKLPDAVLGIAQLVTQGGDTRCRHQDNQGKGEVKGIVLKDGRANHGIDIAEGEDQQKTQCEQDSRLLQDAFE